MPLKLWSMTILTIATTCAHAAEHAPFPFEIPPSFRLHAEWIALNHPVTTTQTAAQSFFNQGLTLIYAFNHDAAYWSFKQAAKVDPGMAMAYWGQALALGQNINMDIDHPRQKEAFKAIQKAKSLTANISQTEKDYIEALATRYTDAEHPDLPQLAKNYHRAMQQLSQKYPDDPDAAVLYAESGLNLNPWKQWTPQGDPQPGTLEVVSVLESVLKRQPEHLGANHYYIHAIEASKHPERALMSAERLNTLMPASGHLIHMPGHIYLLVGDYHKAALANEKAVKVDQQYIDEFGLYGIYPMHYMTHNLYFLSRAYSMQGSFKEAKKAADRLYEFYMPFYQQMPDLEYYLPAGMFVLLRFNKWHDVLAVPKPQGDMPTTKALWYFAQGLALASLGKIDDSQKAFDMFSKAKEDIPPHATYGYNKAATVIQLAELMLLAKIAEAQDNNQKAIELLSQAVDVQDHMNYNEPPDWFFPLRESLGSLLLKASHHAKAEEVFRKDLEHHPRNGRALYGLWQSLLKQGKHSDSYWVEQEFRLAWQYSDSPPS